MIYFIIDGLKLQTNNYHRATILIIKLLCLKRLYYFRSGFGV